MSVSTKRTVVKLIAIDAVAGPEAHYFALSSVLESFETFELALPIRERDEILGHQSAQGAALLRRANARPEIHLVGDGNGDVLHALVSHRLTEIVIHSTG